MIAVGEGRIGFGTIALQLITQTRLAGQSAGQYRIALKQTQSLQLGREPIEGLLSAVANTDFKQWLHQALDRKSIHRVRFS